MSFENVLSQISWEESKDSIYGKTEKDVIRALQKQGKCSPEDFKALVSPAAAPYLEEMARISHALTLRRFGKTVSLYIPVYMSNECQNTCTYCGFNTEIKQSRKTLSMEELEAELLRVKEMGFEHILLVSGDAPAKCGTDYFSDALKLASGIFSQVSIEVQPLLQEEYKRLIDQQLHSVFIYQETYHRERYPVYHKKGQKSDFLHRLETPERLGRAGIHKTGLGVLLGLEDWRTDSWFLCLHLDFLMKRYWKTRYSVSFPRLRPLGGKEVSARHISDRELVQLICAYRLFRESLEISLSTRESVNFRNHMLPLGITHMSAGSQTAPGSYNSNNGDLSQFDVHDHRSPAMVARDINRQGYEAVWKDWDVGLQKCIDCGV